MLVTEEVPPPNGPKKKKKKSSGQHKHQACKKLYVKPVANKSLVNVLDEENTFFLSTLPYALDGCSSPKYLGRAAKR